MLIEVGDGTYIAGPLDVVAILFHEEKKTYHPAFFEEKMIPGVPAQPVEKTENVRLRLKMSHTAGFKTFQEAVTDVHTSMLLNLRIPNEKNKWLEENQVLRWDGSSGSTIVENWLHKKPIDEQEPVLSRYLPLPPESLN